MHIQHYPGESYGRFFFFCFIFNRMKHSILLYQWWNTNSQHSDIFADFTVCSEYSQDECTMIVAGDWSSLTICNVRVHIFPNATTFISGGFLHVMNVYISTDGIQFIFRALHIAMEIELHWHAHAHAHIYVSALNSPQLLYVIQISKAITTLLFTAYRLHNLFFFFFWCQNKHRTPHNTSPIHRYELMKKTNALMLYIYSCHTQYMLL